jgi:hypothetical protein
MWATRFLNAAALVLTSAYVTTLVRDVARPELALGALGCAAGAFSIEAWSPAFPRSLYASGALYVVVNGGVAAGLGVGVEFAVAYAACALILAWIVVAQAQGLVRYDANTASFVLSRSSLYGLLRGVLAFGVREDWFARSASRLVMLGVATAETIGMWVWSSDAYAFAPGSRRFATYALLKTALFAAAPLAEDWILAR